MVTSKERFHDETTTGELGNTSTAPKARVSYSTTYYDKGNRTTASVNVGTNGGSSYTRPGTVPSRSDSVLVTDYGYNASGWLETTTDPKGLVGKTYYDHMGRTIKTIENYVDGTVGDDKDKTVEYTYDANGQMSTLKALLTSGYQETKWIYGITSPIYSNDVLLEMRYPDTSTGNASSSEKDAFTYSNLGEVLTKTDRNGNVHTFTRDILGRQTVDAVTTLGSGVDGSIRRVETSYDTQGNIYQITTFDAATAGNVVNQIQRGYNGLGQMTVEYQAVNGSVNTSTTPKVQYGYSEMASSANHSRLNTITYPNGRVLTYNYASGLDNNISRLSSITDGGTTLESYDYLGYGTVVSRKHAESGVDLTYIKLTGESDGAAGDKYNGLDLFGRVIDQRWTTSGGTTKDRFQYGYDRNSNRLYKENLVSSSNSELYAYDSLNQLTSMERGTLNGGKTALSGAASRSQSWDFDALGNFDSQSTNGTAVNRSHNKQNEITSIAGATTPTYDANGSLTTDETGQTYKYDAWNRQVEVKNNGGTTIALNEYDGITRRVQETRSGTTRDLYYSDSWQVLEERIGGNAHDSYAWSPVFVDAMIARDRDSDNNGSLDERLYAMQDANFNMTGVVNTSGTVVERYQLDAFGTPTYFDANFGSRGSSSYNFNYNHQGLRWDVVTETYSVRNRELRPTVGRWLQNDPIGFDGGTENIYAYTSNNSMIYIDSYGLKFYVTARLQVWDNNNFASDTMIGQIGSTIEFNIKDKKITDIATYEDHKTEKRHWGNALISKSEVAHTPGDSVDACECERFVLAMAVSDKFMSIKFTFTPEGSSERDGKSKKKSVTLTPEFGWEKKEGSAITAVLGFQVCPTATSFSIGAVKIASDFQGRDNYKSLFHNDWALDLSTADLYFGEDRIIGGVAGGKQTHFGKDVPIQQ